MQSQEVSRAHSTIHARSCINRKERIRSIKKLHPQYVVGFIDGEGSFNVSIYYDKTMKNKVFVRPEFSIELRADDRMILERIQKTIGCGKIYNCNYKRYGWYPHVKYKVARIDDISTIVIPFLEKWPLQAKKFKTLHYFKLIIQKRIKGEHLTKKGVEEIVKLREKIRSLGKKHRSETARIRENRSSSGAGQITI